MYNETSRKAKIVHQKNGRPLWMVSRLGQGVVVSHFVPYVSVYLRIMIISEVYDNLTIPLVI